jgi:predicted transposase YbfD/YdcC
VTVPALLSSLIDVPADELSGVLAADGVPCPCLGEWLGQVPDPRSPLGRWHPLVYVLGLAICAFTAAGHESPVAIAEWAAACSQATLAAVGGRRDPWSGRVRPPSVRTFSRVFARIDAEAFNAAVHAYLDALDGVPAGPLPQITVREREQRRAAKAGPAPAGLLPQLAADGKTMRGAVRPDGSQVHLLSVFDVTAGRTRAQREVDAKTNEIPELEHVTAGLDLTGTVLTLDALHTQSETARRVTGDEHGHYLMIVKANQPSLLAAIQEALAGPDSGFAASSWTEQGTGHGRRERRSIRVAPADRIDWPGAGQIIRIRRDTGPTHGPWAAKEIAYGITSLPADLAGPRHLAYYARHHWGIENREHYVRDKTFSEDQQKVRTGNQPAAFAAVRNLVTGAFRHAGYANIAHARRWYGRDDQRILAFYGYA